jgi:hypothetical protein
MLLNLSPRDLSPTEFITPHLADPKSGKDGQRVRQLIAGFDFEGCEAWQALKKSFGKGLRHRELYSLGLILSSEFALAPPTRDAQRSMAVLIKWFHDNWNLIEPILPVIQLLDAEMVPITEERERREAPRRSEF